MKRVVLTERDQRIIDFLNEGFVATTKMIEELFFSEGSSCRRRLKRLVEQGVLKRAKTIQQFSYVYYTVVDETELNQKLGMTKEYVTNLKTELV